MTILLFCDSSIGVCNAFSGSEDSLVSLHGSFFRLPGHDQGVLDLEDARHLASPYFCELPVTRVVDNPQQHGSPVLHDDVDGISADWLHAGEMPLVTQFLQDAVDTARAVPR
jgi:hypothetical protein